MSESGRYVPLVRIPGRGRQTRIVITARHHACEASASLVLEGVLLEAVRRQRSRRPAPEVVAVPLVDLDGVQVGDQGKGRMPRDHNRDYSDRTPSFAATRAVQRVIAASRAPSVCVDLHTPGLRGPMEERPFLAASDEPRDLAAVETLVSMLGDGRSHSLPIVVFRDQWNRSRYDGWKCFTAWSRSVPSVRMAVIVEYPNAVDKGEPVTCEKARIFGRALYGAVSKMLQGPGF